MAPSRTNVFKEEMDEKPYGQSPKKERSAGSPKKAVVVPGWTPEQDAVLWEAFDGFIKTGLYPAVKDHPLMKEKFGGSGTASSSIKGRFTSLIKAKK